MQLPVTVCVMQDMNPDMMPLVTVNPATTPIIEIIALLENTVERLKYAVNRNDGSGDSTIVAAPGAAVSGAVDDPISDDTDSTTTG